MYHWFVRRKLEAAFRAIAQRDYAAIVGQFAASHAHVFHGRHALAGTRTNLASTARWYERLARVFPDLAFEVDDVVIEGTPWNTRAMVAWRDRFTLPNGESGQNQGIHVFELAWGKVRRLEIHCDTSALEGYLARIAELGIGDAVAPPIQDPS